MVDGPHKEQAKRIYHDLRQNVVENIHRVHFHSFSSDWQEFVKTGFMWEQYSPETGEGKRSHPFTGWTALVVNVMAEKY
jgi:mannosyl-oligosaccharide glucosidase